MVNPKMTDEEFEAFYNELFEEYGSTDSGKKAGKPAPKATAPKAAAPKAAPQNGTRKYQGSSAPAFGGSLEIQDEFVPEKKQKSLNGLVLLACLECLGIAGVVVWWLLRIL